MSLRLVLRNADDLGRGLLPAVAAGLFAGRVASELVQPGLAGALFLSALFLVVAVFLVRRLAPVQGGPLLALLLYVLYPEPDPRVALAAAGLAFLVWAIPLAESLAARRPGIMARAAAVVLFAAFLALYVATLAPSVLPADSGEFQVVAAELGVAHPPGFPLYTLFAHAMTRLPTPGSPAYQVNLLSALVAAATLALVYLAAYRLTLRLLPGLAVAIALGTSTTFWAQATTANVRALTAFFAALLLYLLLRRWHDAGEEKPPYSLVAFTLSLGITHHPSLVFIGLIVVVTLLIKDPGWLREPRRWLRPGLAASAGLLPLLYLPLRAGADARGASPALATWSGFLDHVLARGFRGDLFYFTDPLLLWQRLRIMGNVMVFQFHPLLLAGMALGFLWLLWRQRRLAFLLGGSFALHTLVTATYRAPQTVEYMLPAYVPAVLCLAYAFEFHRLFSGLPLTSGERRPGAAYSLLGAVLLLAGLSQGAGHFRDFADLAEARATRATVEPLLDEAPDGAVLLADWHWATPLWYMQEVEGRRREVAVEYVFPTAEPYEETWARRIGEALASGRPAVATHFNAVAYEGLPPPEPLGDAFLFREQPRTVLPDGYHVLDIRLGDVIHLLGYRQEEETLTPGRETAVTIAWRPVPDSQSPVPDLQLFLHLVGFDGALYAQSDTGVRPQPEGISLTRFYLTPRPGAAPGDYSLLAGAVDAATGEQLPGPEGEARVPLATVPVNPLRRPLVTQNAVYRPLVADEAILIGYDWDHTLPGRPRLFLHFRTPAGYEIAVRDSESGQVELPSTRGPWGLARRLQVTSDRPDSFYVPFPQGVVWLGSPLPAEPLPMTERPLILPHTFAASYPIPKNLVVSVRLIGYAEDGFQWAWTDLHDSIPALGAIPTLKWIGGSRVWDPHLLRVQDAASAGQTAGGLLRLYDAFTGRDYPPLDERFEGGLPGVPLGGTTVGR